MTKRYCVERQDDIEGDITYEIWDGMRRMCRISEEESETRAQARIDASLIVRALNAHESETRRKQELSQIHQRIIKQGGTRDALK
jgi:hypothetical protein